MTIKVSKSALKRLSDPVDHEALPDLRAQSFDVVSSEPASKDLDVFRDVFDRPDDADPSKIRLLIQVQAEIRSEWTAVRASFIAIGRALLSLERSLSPNELRRVKERSEQLFSFTDSIASQLRRVANDVDSGRIPEELCPGSYSTAYQLTVLSDQHLAIAQERNLVRPDVTRKALLEFREEMKSYSPPSNITSLREIRQEYRKLKAKRRTLVTEMLGVRARLRDLEKALREP